MKRIFSKDQEEKICKMYKKGKTLINLVEIYGHNKTLFSRILKRNGFQSRISKETGKTGKYASRFMGGRYLNHKGYVCLYMPEYKWCHKGGWIQEHRYVMQEHLGKRLLPKEHVHHINGVKTDNRIENLMVMGASEHSKHHNNLTQG